MQAKVLPDSRNWLQRERPVERSAFVSVITVGTSEGLGSCQDADACSNAGRLKEGEGGGWKI